jgi:glycosyltransferase involved in cell wall biosynthesis
VTAPRVSIGVPVYNGEQYIRHTLDCLLAQTCRDIEIIVTDNGSTDSTPRIVKDYAARDARIRFVSNGSNLGPARNYNRCLELARGEYFKWNPADDVCAADFVEKCVNVLDADPSVVLAHTRTTMIDAGGAEIIRYDYELDLDDPRACVRFARMVNVDHHAHGAHELYGVMRTGLLRTTPGMRTHVRGDSVLLARLLLLGRFRRIEEHLFFNRDHADRSSRNLARRAVRNGSRLSCYLGCGPLPPAEWWDPGLRGRIVFPEWRVLLEYFRAVREAEGLADLQRLLSYAVLGFFTLRHLPKLARDVIIASEQFLNAMLGKGYHRRLSR